MSFEQKVARELAHGERIADTLARTGGEAMHPDHYDFRQSFRDAVLAAMDRAADEHNMPHPTDADLPALFRALDPLAETLWLRRLGMSS